MLLVSTYNRDPTLSANTSSDTEFIVANGETVVAALTVASSTETAREGDRFTATVRQPSHLEGAIMKVACLMFNEAVVSPGAPR